MPNLSGKIILRSYEWMVASLYRIGLIAILTAALLTVTAYFAGIAAAGMLAAVSVFAFGAAAYQVRTSAKALDYPGIDRFFQRVPCYLSIQDKDLRITRSNKLFRRDFGDHQGERCYKAYKNADEPCPNCPVLKTFEDGLTHSTQESAVTQDGRLVQMIVYTTPIHDENGKVTGVMEMSTNISEIKELEGELKKERSRYHDLFEGVPCFISVQDKNLRVIDLNSRFREEFGDAIGNYCFQALKERGQACPDCPVIKTFEDGQVHRREETVVDRNGNLINMLVYSSPIFDENNKVVAVIEMFSDITKVKRLQRELTYIGRTVAVMAHRIKNILMGLQGGIFVVNTGLEDKDKETMLKGWGMIERNVDKVSRIVKDLLYCSKERQPVFQKVDPMTVVRAVYDLFKDRAAREKIDFHLDAPDELPPGRFDTDTLESMLTNLVTNAIDACVNDATGNKDSHRIIIRAACDDNHCYTFEVSDNGPGIPGQVGEAVFDDFYSTKGREGTGLGLLVANKIAEEHGGRITYSSKEGKGTTFQAILPRMSRHPGGKRD